MNTDRNEIEDPFSDVTLRARIDAIWREVNMRNLQEAERMEKKLISDILTAISEGHPEAQRISQFALLATELPFERYAQPLI